MSTLFGSRKIGLFRPDEGPKAERKWVKVRRTHRVGGGVLGPEWDSWEWEFEDHEPNIFGYDESEPPGAGPGPSGGGSKTDDPCADKNQRFIFGPSSLSLTEQYALHDFLNRINDLELLISEKWKEERSILISFATALELRFAGLDLDQKLIVGLLGAMGVNLSNKFSGGVIIGILREAANRAYNKLLYDKAQKWLQDNGYGSKFPCSKDQEKFNELKDKIFDPFDIKVLERGVEGGITGGGG